MRVLDPVGALASRRYGAAGALAIEVADPQGHAAGRFELVVDERGRAEVQRVDGRDASTAWATVGATPVIHLGVHELGAIFLGGVRPSVPRAIELADRMFLGQRTPHLSIWF